MSAAEEIRARVKKADEARIEHRAERAATVAEDHSRRVSLLAQLAQVDTDLDKSVRAALEVMTFGRAGRVRRRAPYRRPRQDPDAGRSGQSPLPENPSSSYDKDRYAGR